jgi:hypothetical protein
MTHSRRFGVSVCGAAAAFLGLAFLRCTIQKPVTPSWDVYAELPIIDSTFTVADLADDSDGMSVSGNNVYIDIDQEPEAVRIGDYLTTRMVWNQDDLDFSGIGFVRGSRQSLADTLVMDNSILIEEAELDSGSVIFEIDNQSGFTLNLHAEVPSLQYFNGDPVVLDYGNIGLGKRTFEMPLKDIRFRPQVDAGKNRVPYSGTIQLQDFVDGYHGIVRVRVDLSRVKYKRVTGWLNRTEADIDETVETGIDVSDEFQGIALGSALMNLTFFNHVQAPGSLDVTVTGISGDGRTASVPIQASVGASSETTVGPLEVVELANLLPKTLRIRGKLYLGDGHSKSSVSYDDSISSRIHIKAPLIFSLPAKTNETEPDTIEIKGNRDFFRKNLKEAGLSFTLQNHVPLGVSASFYFSKSRGDATLFDHPDFYRTVALSRPVTSPAPGSAGTPGLVTAASLGTVTVALDSTEIRVFDNPQVYWGMRLTFPGTEGMVRVRGDDWIRVQCRVQARVLADFEDEDEKGGGR